MRQTLARFFVAATVLLVGIAATVEAQTRPTAQQFRQRLDAKPEWVEANTEAPGGTQYVKFASKTLGADVSYLVYLPPEYEKQTDKRYPVIYWLHGLGGNQRGGATMFVPRVDAAIRDGSLPPTIVVLVNGMINGFYNDWQDGARPLESVIVNDLVPHVDATYRTIASREGRLIQGFSMGGYGAGHLGFKYPMLFGTVVIDAGALIAELALSGPAIKPIFDGAWGGDLAKFTAEHPNTLVEKNLDQIRGRTLIRVGVGADDNLLARNRELHELLDKLDVEHEYVVVPGVGHNAAAYYAALGEAEFAVHRRAFAKLESK